MSETIQPLRRPNGTYLPGAPGKQPGHVSVIGKVKQTCEKMGFDWVVEAINRFRDPSVPHSDRTQCLQMIADRIAPKLKAIEVRSDSANALQQVLINVIGAQPQSAQADSQTYVPDRPQAVQVADDSETH